MAELMYQTLEVPNRPMFVGGPSARGEAVGGGVKLLHKGIQALNKLGVSRRVEEELKKLEPTLHASMPATGGILVCVGLQEWERPDPTGARAQGFLGIHVAGSGPDPQTVLKQYQDTPKFVAGAPKGWRRRDEFIWVSRKGTGPVPVLP